MMDKKQRILIDIHSFVDVITNSSTELFVCDTEKSLELVRQLVDEIQDKYPNEYGHRLCIDYSDSYDLGWALGYMDEDEEEKAVKELIDKGYKIEALTGEIKKKYISISAERGGLDCRVQKFIEDTFNVIFYTTEA